MSTPLDLLGDWRFERSIDDRFAGELLEVSGTALLSRTDGGAVCWHEEGVLRRPTGATAEVTRTLLIVPPSPGWDGHGWDGLGSDGRWWVTFRDGNPFHSWTPGHDVDHRCPPDRYRGRVELDLPTGWSVTWEVTGPTKRYAMSTAYRRLERSAVP